MAPRQNYRYIPKDNRPPNGGCPPGVPRNKRMYHPMGYWPGPPQYANPVLPTPKADSVHPSNDYQWHPLTTYPFSSYGQPTYQNRLFQQPPYPPPPIYQGYPQPVYPPTPHPVYPPTPQSVYPPTPRPIVHPAPRPVVHGAVPPAPGVPGGTPSKLPPGARIRGQIPVFPNLNSTHITTNKIVTFHVIRHNAKPWLTRNPRIEFNIVTAECGMAISDFMKGLGLEKFGPNRAPLLDLGFVECYEVGNGAWQTGIKFVMGDPLPKLAQTLAEVGWDEYRGEAGKGKPVWLTLLP